MVIYIGFYTKTIKKIIQYSLFKDISKGLVHSTYEIVNTSFSELT